MVVEVIVDILSVGVDKVFDYVAPENVGVVIGDRVSVPFGRRSVEGFVVGNKETSEYVGELKQVIKRLDGEPALTASNLALAKWISETYHVTLAESLRLFIPAEMRGGKVSPKSKRRVGFSTGVTLDAALSRIGKNALRQGDALRYLADNGNCDFSLLTKKFGASAVNSLEKKGILSFSDINVSRIPYGRLDARSKEVELTAEQTAALDEIRGNPNRKFLLFGITGSGKTEIYIRSIKDALSCGKTAIMLVPEIALTPQVIARFRGEFGDSVAILHSGLSQGERFDEWRRLRRGEARVAVGVRSAIFAPLENVGIIIIDEQHETSYVSESSPRYSTVDVAKKRCESEGATLLMGSATPLVESFYRAKQGEYRLLRLKNRPLGATLPDLRIVDMREEVRRGNSTALSSALIEEMEEELSRNRQVMLFLNRRGFSPTVVCAECGYVAKCMDCDVPLNYHKDEDMLKCHCCGAKYRMLDECPNCRSKYIRRSGHGTQRVEYDLGKQFPKARVLRMDNDSTRGKEGHLKLVEAFFRHEADILVGTQMIAKGHDFQNVTLVGILDADASLYFSDYRSGERAFSLITQVAGRAGRGSKAGKVILQTHTPYSDVFKYVANYDYEGFYGREIAIREAAKFPPFCRIVRIMITAEKQDDAALAMKSAYEKIETLKNEKPSMFLYLGKMRSPVRYMMRKYRYQVLMKLAEPFSDEIVRSLYAVIDGCAHKGVTIYLESDPVNMN